MKKPMMREHNIETNIVTDREMTNEEFAQYEADLFAKAERDAEQASKDAARQAVLDKLGLTADEVAALLG